MSKIITAMNAMITRIDKVTEVVQGVDGEIFFTYDSKYSWSIKKSDELYLWFYPGQPSLQELSEPNVNWKDVPMVVYSMSEVGGREARETFDELHTALKEKIYGVDMVLKDIIDGADDIPF